MNSRQFAAATTFRERDCIARQQSITITIGNGLREFHSCTEYGVRRTCIAIEGLKAEFSCAFVLKRIKIKLRAVCFILCICNIYISISTSTIVVRPKSEAVLLAFEENYFLIKNHNLIALHFIDSLCLLGAFLC